MVEKTGDRAMRELHVRELMQYLFSKWLILLLCGIIFAAAGAGYAFMKGKGNTETSSGVDYDQQLSDYENNVDALKEALQRNQARINAEYDYLQNSVIMNIDPYHEVCTSGTIKLATKTAGDKGDLSAVADAMINSVRSNEIMSALANKYETEPQYVLETISIERLYVGATVPPGERSGSSEDDEANVIIVENTTDDKGIVLSIQVIGENKEYTEGLCQDVIEEIQRLGSNEYKNIEVSSYNLSTFEQVDRALLETQRNVQRSFIDLNSSRTSYNDALNSLTRPQQPGSSGGKRPLLFGIIGFLGGIILAAAVLCVVYMQDGRIRSVGELQRLKDIRNLAVFGAKGSTDTEVETAYINIKEFAGDDARVLLTGMAMQESFDDICQKLTAVNEKKQGKLSFSKAPDFLRDSSSRENLIDHQSIVLLESRKTSKLEEIVEEMKQLKEYGKEPVGIILL